MIPADTPPPLYFTSTNARASARAWLSSPSEGLETFKVKLNGELVYSKTFPYTPGELHSQWQAHVMFDSTHWGASQTHCTVRLEVTEFGDPTEHASEVTVPIKNMAKQYDVMDEKLNPASAPIVMSWMAIMGYRTHTHSQDGWPKLQFLSEMQGASVEYFGGHGNASPSFDDDAPGQFADTIVPADVQAYRSIQMGTGLPPFNSTGRPPIAFAFIHACSAATDMSFNVFNLPYANNYGGWMEDQAITGFNQLVRLSQFADLSAMYHQQLYWGKTLFEARRFIVVNGDFESAPPSAGPPWSPLLEGHMPIWGDFRTKLRGVYAPENVPLPSPLTWFRVVQG